MKTLKTVTLTDEQRRAACGVINSFGSAQHPWADDSTLDSFAVPYVKRCATIARKQLQKRRDTIMDDTLLDRIEDRISETSSLIYALQRVR
jgi:hypothetical protein